MKTSYKVNGLNMRLKQAVADSNLSMADISRRSGVSRSCIWSYLIAGNNPSVYTLARLAVVLHVSTDWLLGVTE